MRKWRRSRKSEGKSRSAETILSSDGNFLGEVYYLRGIGTLSQREADLIMKAGKTLSFMEKYYFCEGDFGFEVKKGTNSTLLHFTSSIEGAEHPDEVLIWIPTEALEALKAAL